jgi:hypothetical protein
MMISSVSSSFRSSEFLTRAESDQDYITPEYDNLLMKPSSVFFLIKAPQ